MDGIELSRRFRELTNDKLAPIIILSAMHRPRHPHRRAVEAGAVDYVSKPFDPLELEARVAAQFRMRELAVRLHRAEQLSTLGDPDVRAGPRAAQSGERHRQRGRARCAGCCHPSCRGRARRSAQLLEVVQECAEQIGVLSRQLLGFRGQGQDLDLRVVPINVLATRALKICSRDLEQIDVRVDVPADSEVRCAPPLLLQVLTNLIENAAYAAQPGGWVAISASIAAGRVRIEVADSGPGVPKGLREHDVRALLHDEARGRRHRARPVPGARDRGAPAAARSSWRSAAGATRSSIELPGLHPPPDAVAHG